MKRYHLLYCFVLLLSLLFLPVTAGATNASLDHFQRNRSYSAQFNDVSSSDWFAANIQSAYELGLMNGQSAEQFAPYGNVTLAEAATMAARLHCIYHTGAEDFPPSGTRWYDPYLNYLKQNGIRSVPATGLDRAATRAQFAAILSSAFDDPALAPINSMNGFIIPDVAPTADAADAVYRFYSAGILTGEGADHTFSPNATITRAQAAAVVTRMAIPSLRVQIDFSVLPADTVPPSPAQQVLQQINQIRQQNHLTALRLDERVQAAAQIRAQEIVSNFSHVRPDGSKCFSALAEQAVSYSAAGENIAAGQRTAEEVVDAWMRSPAHRDNILNGEFTIMGIGYYEANDSNGPYWVQILIG